MNCPHCGAPAAQPNGTCATCGRAVNTPPTADDPTALHYPPAVDPFATGAPLTGTDPLAPYTAPDPYTPSAPQSYSQSSPPSAPYSAPEPYTAPGDAYGKPAEPRSASTSPTSGGGPYPPPQYPGQPYPPQAYPGQPPYPYAPARSPGQGFSITAFVLAAIAVFAIPIVFGVAAIICAAIARRRGEQYASLAMKLAGAGMLLGIVFGFVARALF